GAAVCASRVPVGRNDHDFAVASANSGDRIVVYPGTDAAGRIFGLFGEPIAVWPGGRRFAEGGNADSKQPTAKNGGSGVGAGRSCAGTLFIVAIGGNGLVAVAGRVANEAR